MVGRDMVVKIATYIIGNVGVFRVLLVYKKGL
jgi:hypothetical protein